MKRNSACIFMIYVHVQTCLKGNDTNDIIAPSLLDAITSPAVPSPPRSASHPTTPLYPTQNDPGGGPIVLGACENAYAGWVTIVTFCDWFPFFSAPP